MQIAIIAAIALNRVIGKDGKVPWNIPEDLQRFRRLTMGHPVVIGRRTYESIGHPLEGRRNVVIASRKIPGVEVFPSIRDAVNALEDEGLVFVIGGGMVFRETLSAARLLYLTLVDQEPEGDTYFPPYEHLIGTEFALTAREAHPGFTFADYARIPVPE